VTAPNLPALPSIQNAKLPATYAAAKAALEKCSRIDECQDWADKAEALASYAKQAGDDAMHKMADRIQARAIQKCGELLKRIEPGKPGPKSGGTSPQNSRSAAARDAGLSIDQKKTALRVASVPAEEFEQLVESDKPPTVTELAERGKKESTAHLKGRDPKDFAASTRLQGECSRFAEFVASADFDAALRGSFPDDIEEIRFNAAAITKRLASLISRIESKRRR
jgi:hypothetical protein